MAEKFAVVIDGRIFVVKASKNGDLARILCFRVLKTRLSVMTINDFLTMADRHHILKQVSKWDPFWV